MSDSELRQRLLDIFHGYEEALENDYGQEGEFEGMRPDEIISSMIMEVRHMDK